MGCVALLVLCDLDLAGDHLVVFRGCALIRDPNPVGASRPQGGREKTCKYSRFRANKKSRHSSESPPVQTRLPRAAGQGEIGRPWPAPLRGYEQSSPIRMISIIVLLGPFVPALVGLPRL